MSTERIDIVVTEQGSRVVRRDIEDIGAGARSAKANIDFLKDALKALAAYFAIDQLRRWVDTWTQIENQLRQVTASTNDLRMAQERLFTISQQTRSSLEANATLYQRLSVSANELSASNEKMMKFVEGVNKALALNGGNANEARGALIQLSQALGSGTVRAEEFNSILEGAKPILQAVADGIRETNGSVAKLRQMMLDGQLSSKTFFDAFLTQLPKLDQQFKATTVTIGQAMTVLDNALTKSIGQMDQATGTSAKLGKAILVLADNIDVVLRGLLSLAAGVSAAFAARALLASVGTIQAALSGIVAFLGGPWAVALAAAAGAITFLASQESATTKASRDHAEALKEVGGAAQRMEEQLKAANKQLENQERLLARAKLATAKENMAATKTELAGGDFSVSFLPLQLGQSSYQDLRNLQNQLRAGKLDVEQFAESLVKLTEKYSDNAALQKHVVELMKGVDAFRAAKSDAEKYEAALKITTTTTDGAAKSFVRASAGLGTMVDKLKEVYEKIRVIQSVPGVMRKVEEMVGPAPAVPNVNGLQDRRGVPEDAASSDYFMKRNVATEVVTKQMNAEGTALIKNLKDLKGIEVDYQKAVASGNVTLIARAGAAREVAQMVANGELIESKAADVLKQKTAIALAEVAGQAGAATVELNLNATAAGRLAEAAGKGEAAQRAANYANKEAEATSKGLIALSAMRAANAQEEAAAVLTVRNETVRGLELETTNQNRLAEAYAVGFGAVRRAQEEEYKLSLVRKLGTDATLAGTKAQKALNDAMDAYRQNRASNDNEAQQERLRAANDELGLLKKEVDLQGLSDRERTTAIQHLRDEYEIRKRMPEATNEQVQAELKVADAVAQTKQQLTDAQRARDAWIEPFKNAAQGIQQAFSQAFENIFSGGVNSFKTLGQQILKLMIQLAAQIAALLVFRPIVGGVMQSVGLGGTANQMGMVNSQGQTLGFNDLLNFGTQKAVGYGVDKAMGYSGVNISGMIDNVGYSTFGIGTPLLSTTSQMAATTGGLASSAQGIGVASIPGGVGNVATAGGTSSATQMTGIAGGASGYLGAIGGGAFGGMLGGMIGTATNSKAIGGLSGAALGAASAWAVGAMMGSSLGPIGTAIGAVVGAIVGLVTTVKKSTNYIAAYYETDPLGKETAKSSGADHTVSDKLPEFESSVKSVSDIFNGIIKAGDLKLSGNMGFYLQSEKGVMSTHLNGPYGANISSSDNPTQIAIDALKYVVGGGAGGPTVTGNEDILKAVKNSKATTPEDFIKDLDFAQGFRDQLDLLNKSLDPTNNQIKTFTENAKQIGEQIKTSITDWREKAKELGLATDAELLPALRKGLAAMMGLGPTVEPLRGLAAVTKQAEINLEQFKPALTALGYTAAEQAKIAEDYKAKAVKDYEDAVSMVKKQGHLSVDASVKGVPGTLSYSDQFKLSGYSMEEPGMEQLASSMDNIHTAASRGALSVNDMYAELALLDRQLHDGVMTAEGYGTAVSALTSEWNRSQAVVQTLRQGLAQITAITEPGKAQTATDVLNNAMISQVDLGEQRSNAIPEFRVQLDALFTSIRTGKAGFNDLTFTYSQLTELLKTGAITGDQFNSVLSAMTSAWQKAAQEQRDLEDLTVRSLKGQGRGTEAADLEFRLKQQRELQAAVTAGYGEAYINGLKYVQGLETQAYALQKNEAKMATFSNMLSRWQNLTGDSGGAGLTQMRLQQLQERNQYATNYGAGSTEYSIITSLQSAEYAQAEAKNDQQNLLAAIDHEIKARQDSIKAIQEGALVQYQIAKQFRSAYDALQVNQSSIYSPGEKLDKLRQQFEDAYNTAKSSTATDDAKSAARDLLLSLGPQLISTAKENFGTTDVTDFQRVSAIFKEFGTISSDIEDTATKTLEEQQKALKVLEQQRDIASNMGQRTLGSIDDLRAKAERSQKTFDDMLTALQKKDVGIATLSGEQKYLSANPDVAAAVANGSFYSGRQHYDLYGKAEGRLWNDELTSGMFTDATQKQLNAWIPIAKQRNSSELLTAAYSREVQLGSYWGKDSYAGPDHGGVLYQKWDDQATGDALSFLNTLGYTGAYDVNANIFLQSHNKGDAYTAWVESYGKSRGWYASGGIIPAGALGIAGETGMPELVFGPAYVANPKLTQDLMGAANDPGNVVALQPRSGREEGSDEALRAEVRALRELMERLLEAFERSERRAGKQRADIGGVTVESIMEVSNRLMSVEKQLRNKA